MSEMTALDLQDVLIRAGFTKCDIPACNCGSWHHRYGLPERFAEIKEVLIDADVLNNDTGNLPLNAIKKLVLQRDAALADAERYRWLRENPVQCANFADNQTYGRNKDKPELLDAAIDEARGGK